MTARTVQDAVDEAVARLLDHPNEVLDWLDAPWSRTDADPWGDMMDVLRGAA